MFLVPEKYYENGLKSSTFTHVPEEITYSPLNIYYSHGKSLELLSGWVGVSKVKTVKGKYEAEWQFLGEGGRGRDSKQNSST